MVRLQTTQMIDEKVKDYLLVTIENHLPEEQKLQAVIISWGLYKYICKKCG
ncbi:hypothetical protein LZ480_10620 [Solibacillus sp. MA9]|uniref:Uncharacterized protein n=1 Tax=Solibacillus palustris TaxID=2908203 RepID=A0ABS9UDY4_9BACL|nr:hypothetical protein [Solibacillus sp. MA9]MCH7322344.1 hypothetical protein [Solibacillus sp. MA9]